MCPSGGSCHPLGEAQIPFQPEQVGTVGFFWVSTIPVAGASELWRPLPGVKSFERIVYPLQASPAGRGVGGLPGGGSTRGWKLCAGELTPIPSRGTGD